MKNVNIGIVNLVVSNRLKESYFNNQLIDESKTATSELLNVVKSSPVLQLEFKVFCNIEGKHIDNELSATRYIDNNVKLFEIYTIEEIDVERAKLKQFIGENEIHYDDDRVKLYQAIDNLIYESLENYNDIDVDKMHESFTMVLDHIKAPKKTLLENVDVQPVNEDVIEMAVEKFNEKYASLDENDRKLLQTLIKANKEEKKELLETYKKDSLAILESVDKDSTKDSIAKAIEKIKEMVYNEENVTNDIIGLHDLQKGLL